MVANQRKPEPHPETFLSRANGKTFEAVRRLLDGAGQRPSISSSLLSHTEAGALGVPPSVIASVQDLARPLADVLNRGGKGRSSRGSRGTLWHLLSRYAIQIRDALQTIGGQLTMIHRCCAWGLPCILTAL
jgi:hypothetical protein